MEPQDVDFIGFIHIGLFCLMEFHNVYIYICDTSGAIRFKLSNISETTSLEYFPSFRNINLVDSDPFSCSFRVKGWPFRGASLAPLAA